MTDTDWTPTVTRVVVDDHSLFREGVASLLARADDIALVGEAATGEDAVPLVEDVLPDIVLMDVKMPGMGGIEATRRIVAQVPHIGVLMLTMFEDDESVFAALKAGARGYVLKDADRGTLLRAIRCARRSAACSLHRTTGAGSIYPHGAAAIDHSNRATITRRTFYGATL